MMRASGSSQRSVRSAVVAITQSPTQFGSRTPIRTREAPCPAKGGIIGNGLKSPNGSLGVSRYVRKGLDEVRVRRYRPPPLIYPLRRAKLPFACKSQPSISPHVSIFPLARPGATAVADWQRAGDHRSIAGGDARR